MWVGSGASLLLITGGELREGFVRRTGGHGEVLRGSRGEAAGVESGASFVERSQVNVGTVPVLPPGHAASVVSGAGSVVDRSGRDGAEPP